MLLPHLAICAGLALPADVEIGAGRHAYRWSSGWIQPPDQELGNTHGVIVEDRAGNLYVNTDTARAISVYGRDGKFVRSFAADQGEGIHGMTIVEQGGRELLYHVNFRLGVWRVLTLDGEVLETHGAPLESKKYEDASQFRPTSIAVAPDGRVYVADGYGRSWVHVYDARHAYTTSFGGPDAMRCCHGLLMDARGPQPRLVVADRENHRLLVHDLDGRQISVVEGMFRRPCSMQAHGEFLAVPDLAGRVTLLDGANRLVMHLGDQPDPSLRAENGVPREKWRDGVFMAPHSAHFDRDGNLYVMDWNHLGRINKLERIAPLAQPEGVGYEDTPFVPGSGWRVHDKMRPVPPVVAPQPFVAAPPPADAIVLFDGKDLSRWKSGDRDGQWKVESGFMEVNGTGGIETKDGFGDVQLHLEFATPANVVGKSQERGNSGVFLMGRYEVQILDGYENRTYADGQCAALYGQRPPLANVCRKPGEWQSYDLAFRAPRFDGDVLLEPARVTVIHNGVVVQANEPFLGATRHRDVASYAPHAPTGPIALQDHGNPMRFRNVWVRRL